MCWKLLKTRKYWTTGDSNQKETNIEDLINDSERWLPLNTNPLMCSFPAQQPSLQPHMWATMLRRQKGRLAGHLAISASSAGRRQSHSRTASCWCWAPTLPGTGLAVSQDPRAEHSPNHHGREELKGTVYLSSYLPSGMWLSMNNNDYELFFSMNIGYFSYSTWWWPLTTSEMKTLNIMSMGKLNGQTDTASLWTLLGSQADHLLLWAQVSLALFLSLCLIWTPHYCSFPFSLLIEMAAQMTETKKGSSWYNSIQTGEERVNQTQKSGSQTPTPVPYLRLHSSLC